MKRLIVLALVFVLLLGSALASAQEDKSLKGAVGAALLDEAVLPASGPESQPYLAIISCRKRMQAMPPPTAMRPVFINSKMSRSMVLIMPFSTSRTECRRPRP